MFKTRPEPQTTSTGQTVYERLKEDFADGRVFDRDPLIPLSGGQDEAGAAPDRREARPVSRHLNST